MGLRIRSRALFVAAPFIDVQQQDLLTRNVESLRPVIQIADLSYYALIQLLLYGDHDLSKTRIEVYSNSLYVLSMRLVGLIEISAVLSNHQVP